MIELAEPQEHYRTVCQSMMREALAIMVLDKEEEGKSCYQQQDNIVSHSNYKISSEDSSFVPYSLCMVIYTQWRSDKRVPLSVPLEINCIPVV